MLLQQAEMALFGPPGAAAAVAAVPASPRPPAFAAGQSPYAGAPHLAEPGDAATRPPALEVSIGRLDVVAPPPAPVPVPRRRPRLRPQTTLASYLDRRRQVIP